MSHDLKAAAVDFLTLAATKNVREAYREHAGPQFRHHNAFFKGDAQSLMLAMEENAAKNPHKVHEVQRAIGDGDLVAVHSHVRMNANDRGAALVHIFRFEGDKVAELWDIAQPVPEHVGRVLNPSADAKRPPSAADGLRTRPTLRSCPAPSGR